MKIAILGAGGFVGQRTTEWLKLRGLASPVPVVRSHSAGTRIARLGIPYCLADALDEEAMTRAFEGCEVIVHSVAGDNQMMERAPGVAVAAAKRAGARRIVYLSTGMVYGYQPLPTDDDETPPRVAQPSGYNRSKSIAELRFQGLRSRAGIDIVILRPTIVTGPRGSGFTVRLASNLLSGQAFLVDSGAGVCNAVHVDNLVTAIWLAATTPGATNQTFVVSDRERVTWFDLYRSVAEAVDVPIETIRQLRSSDYPALATPPRGKPLSEWLMHERLKGIRKKVPPGARAALLSAHRAWQMRHDSTANGTAPDPWQFILQTCQVQLPIGKAERLLGYDPIPFADGARRTSLWLRSMGFDAHDAAGAQGDYPISSL